MNPQRPSEYAQSDWDLMSCAQQRWAGWAAADLARATADPRECVDLGRVLVRSGRGDVRRARRAILRTGAMFVQIVSRRGELVSVVDRLGHGLETYASLAARMGWP